MSKTSWRNKSKSRFKKPTASFFGFAEEETTFDAQNILESNLDLNTTVAPALINTEAPVHRKSKVSIDDFSFFDEDEPQPLNIIAKSIQKADLAHEANSIQSFQTQKQPIITITESKRSPELGLNSVGTESKRSPNGVQNADPSLLIGRERQLLGFIVLECQRIGSLTTEPLTIERIKEVLDASTDAVKTAIKRLGTKHLIERGFRKNGRSGWVQYTVSKSTYEKVIFLETVSKRSRNSVGTESERRPESGSERGLNASYSSSINFLNENTITIAVPENLKRFGISAVNLQSLVTSGKAQLEVIERSLSALSYDVENGKTGSLANILFGVLNAGREYVSQKFSENLQAELNQELARIIESEENQKRVTEAKLAAKFKEYLAANPSFLDLVQDRHKGLVEDPSILEKVAFEEFKMDEAVSR